MGQSFAQRRTTSTVVTDTSALPTSSSWTTTMRKTQMLKKAFAMFDQGKTGFIETTRVAAILNTMGQQFDNGELQIMIEQADKENTGKLNFQSFIEIAANFLEEEDDA